MGGGVPPTELAVLTRQLEELLGAGVQLVEALGTLADQSTRPTVKRMLSQVREAVREGSSLADALAAHPNVFSDLYVGMVRAGETAGALKEAVSRSGRDKDWASRNKCPRASNEPHSPISNWSADQRSNAPIMRVVS